MDQEVDSNDRVITITHLLPEMKTKKEFIMFSVKIYLCKYVINDWNNISTIYFLIFDINMTKNLLFAALPMVEATNKTYIEKITRTSKEPAETMEKSDNYGITAVVRGTQQIWKPYSAAYIGSL